MKRVGPNLTRMDYYSLMNMNGKVPKFVSKILLPAYIGGIPIMRQEHFQNQRQLSLLDHNDGRIMGIMLMIKKKGESVEKRLETFLSKNEALQQLKTTTFPQLDGMMLALLKNKLFHKKAKQQQKRSGKVGVEPPNNRLTRIFRSHPVSAVKILNDLTEAEATKIGRSFALLLLTTTEPSAAVDAWKLDNQVLVSLFAEHAWFEPMINAIAKQLLKRSNLGLKWRVGLGAILSIGDIITDVSVIISYLKNGDTAQAYSLMGMMGASISLQLPFI